MDELVRVDTYETISDSLRPWLAAKLKDMYEALAPYVDGSFGEVAPAHAAAAVAVLRELGRLYRVHEVPRQVQVGMSEAQVAAAISEAVAAARLEWELSRRALEAANRQLILERVRANT